MKPYSRVDKQAQKIIHLEREVLRLKEENRALKECKCKYQMESKR